MGKYSYKTSGTCSAQIDFELNDGIISGVEFLGGCSGNLQGICRLTEGKSAEEVIGSLGGILCGYKETSCPDQLAQALRLALSEEQNK